MQFAADADTKNAALHNMKDLQSTQLIHMLLTRLERIPADSYWAHRAGGVRGALLRMMGKIENGEAIPKFEIKRLLEMGFSILKNAARKNTNNNKNRNA